MNNEEVKFFGHKYPEHVPYFPYCLYPDNHTTFRRALGKKSIKIQDKKNTN
jgi:hypothetical protein